MIKMTAFSTGGQLDEDPIDIEWPGPRAVSQARATCGATAEAALRPEGAAEARPIRPEWGSLSAGSQSISACSQ